jgi:4-hydroxy-3-methylbut-2-enyl diphosphate reductase IspH
LRVVRHDTSFFFFFFFFLFLIRLVFLNKHTQIRCAVERARASRTYRRNHEGQLNDKTTMTMTTMPAANESEYVSSVCSCERDECRLEMRADRHDRLVFSQRNRPELGTRRCGVVGIAIGTSTAVDNEAAPMLIVKDRLRCAASDIDDACRGELLDEHESIRTRHAIDAGKLNRAARVRFAVLVDAHYVLPTAGDFVDVQQRRRRVLVVVVVAANEQHSLQARARLELARRKFTVHVEAACHQVLPMRHRQRRRNARGCSVVTATQYKHREVRSARHRCKTRSCDDELGELVDAARAAADTALSVEIGTAHERSTASDNDAVTVANADRIDRWRRERWQQKLDRLPRERQRRRRRLRQLRVRVTTDAEEACTARREQHVCFADSDLRNGMRRERKRIEVQIVRSSTGSHDNATIVDR